MAFVVLGARAVARLAEDLLALLQRRPHSPKRTLNQDALMISKLLCRNHYASRCADVNFPPVVVDGRNQAGLVSPDIENGQFPEPEKRDQPKTVVES